MLALPQLMGPMQEVPVQTIAQTAPLPQSMELLHEKLLHFTMQLLASSQLTGPRHDPEAMQSTSQSMPDGQVHPVAQL